MVQTHQSALACCIVPGLFDILVADGHALVVLGDLGDLGVVGDQVADLPGEALPIMSMPPTGWNMVVWNS